MLLLLELREEDELLDEDELLAEEEALEEEEEEEEVAELFSIVLQTLSMSAEAPEREKSFYDNLVQSPPDRVFSPVLKTYVHCTKRPSNILSGLTASLRHA